MESPSTLFSLSHPIFINPDCCASKYTQGPTSLYPLHHYHPAHPSPGSWQPLNVSLLLALLLFILYPHGNKTKPVKRQDGSCPLHCSKHTTACEALHHLPISLLTPNTSLTSSSSSPLTHTHPSTGLLAGAQTCQEYSVLRALEFAVPSAWPTMSAFSHTTPSLTSFKSSLNC